MAGIEENPIRLVQAIYVYKKSESAAKIDTELSEWFMTNVGLRQGCMLSVTLFIVTLDDSM